MKDEKMTDDALNSLKSLRAAQPSPEAKKLALNGAMVAFDAAQTSRNPKRAGWLSGWKLGAGIGLPVGTAVAALVLFPISTQLVATNNSVDGVPPVVTESTIATKEAPAEQIALQMANEGEVRLDGIVEAPKPVAGGAANMATEAAPPPMSAKLAAEPVGGVAVSRDALRMAAPAASADMAYDGATRAVSPMMVDGDVFASFEENRTKITAEEPVSTFSIDVDTASYSYVRSLLEDGYLPGPDAVRVEELINYFPYDYSAPSSLDTPFSTTMSVIPTPWNARTKLLQIGLKGYVPPATERQSQNLTFLLDTSGSMDEPNKLPLLKRALTMLVDNMKPDDTVSIVAYAGSSGVVLEPTPASNRLAIVGALDRLDAGGSTAGAEGIALAYRLAEQNRKADGINRVILATDGDFNVGIDDPEELKAYIKTQRDKGISLSVLGFGRGNLDDALMQALAQNGNGNASYIDSFREAQKVLVEEGGANLVTIAKDVKIQVEFNPAVVSEYRLVGYETRALNREDFNNDAVDAGEIGAGHTVTALYEVALKGEGGELNDPLRYGNSADGTLAGELGFLKLRYKAPEGMTSKLIDFPITRQMVVGATEAGNDQRFAAAVAAFGQKLKGSAYAQTMSWDAIAALANGAKGEDRNGYRAEFVQLVNLAKALSPDGAVTPPTLELQVLPAE